MVTQLVFVDFKFFGNQDDGRGAKIVKSFWILFSLKSSYDETQSKESEFLKRERTCWPLRVSEYEVRDVGW